MSEQVTGQLSINYSGFERRPPLRYHLHHRENYRSVQSMLFQIASGMGGAGGAIGTVAGQDAMTPRYQGQARSAFAGGRIECKQEELPSALHGVTKIQVGKKLGTSRLYIQTPSETYKFKFQFIKLEQVESSIRSFLPSSVLIESGQLD